MGNNVSSGSSSDATETDNNSSNEHYDYDKSLCLIDDTINSLQQTTTVSYFNSDINLQNINTQYDVNNYNNDDNFVSNKQQKYYSRKINNNFNKCDSVDNTITKFVPVSSITDISTSNNMERNKKLLSYEQLVNNSKTKKPLKATTAIHYDKINNIEMIHDHYMLPTTNKINKRSSLSLFNPDFLPNFNDMLAYVSQTNNTTTTEQTNSTTRQSFDTDINNYQVLQQKQQFNNTTENFYASVVIPNTEQQDTNTIEYNF